jgi:large subunit ribosomal protein L29
VKRTDTNSLQDPELAEFIGDKRQELFNLRFQHATGALDNTAALARVKRDIARLLTYSNHRAREPKEA